MLGVIVRLEGIDHLTDQPSVVSRVELAEQQLERLVISKNKVDSGWHVTSPLRRSGASDGSRRGPEPGAQVPERIADALLAREVIAQAHGMLMLCQHLTTHHAATSLFGPHATLRRPSASMQQRSSAQPTSTTDRRRGARHE